MKSGDRLGPYEIAGLVGSGGMGAVYRARDARLDRTVAIKVVHARFAADADQLRRFEQEARAASQLAHPNILVVHDIGSHDGSPYIVSELLDGESLREKLARPLPPRKAVEYAVQVAQGLAAAHAKGIIHRDLKPENLFVTNDGRIKILDFGIAKLTQPGTPSESRTQAVTTMPDTEPGVVVGTVGYMSPEQVLGKPLDVRSDLFSLGVVLYEMLAGKRPFRKETAPETMAAILREELPELSDTNTTVPAGLERIVRHCLEKEPTNRFQSARDVVFALESLSQSTTAVAAPLRLKSRTRRLGNVALGLTLVAGWSAALFLWTRPAPRTPLTHLSVQVNDADELSSGGITPVFVSTPGGSRTAIAWTPDGQALVFVGRRNGVQQLYLRRLDAATARPIPGTEGAQVPAISADGQSVAFWAAGAIKKAPIRGGPVEDRASGIALPPWGMAWDDRGSLFFGNVLGSIGMITPEGKTDTVTKVSEAQLFHTLPWPLPGGRVLLYTVRKRFSSWGDEEVVAETLATGQRKVLLKDATDARYVRVTGHLVFLRRGKLFAAPFDPDRLTTGIPVPVLDQVAQELTAGDFGDMTGAGQFAISANGTLAWLTGQAAPSFSEGDLVTVDRNTGLATPLPAPARNYGFLRLSPDGRRLAATIPTLTEVGLWVYDIERGGGLSQLMLDGEVGVPRWYPNGERLAFDWLKDGRPVLASQITDGSQSAHVLVPGGYTPSSFDPGGRLLAAGATPRHGIFVVTERDGKAGIQSLIDKGRGERAPDVSPDGRWIAYESKPLGVEDWRGYQIYVRSYPEDGPTVQVSFDGGLCAAWNPKNGRELFFAMWQALPKKHRMMAVDFTPGTPPRVGTPRLLFEFDERDLASFICGGARCYDVSPDGQRFYTVKLRLPPPKPVVTHINLIMNWFEELKTKVPVQ